MPSRRQFVAGLGAAALGTALPLTRALAESTEPAMARIRRTKTLRSGVIAGAAPYFAKVVGTGKWEGFGPDFSAELAKTLGVEVKYVETTWGNAVMDLQANKIDCMFGMGPTPQRRKMIGFTDPLFHNTFTLVARKGFDPKTWEEADKSGVKISVDIGSNQDAFATKTFHNAQIRRFDTSGDATLALQTGRVDAQLLVALLGVTVLAKAPGLGHIVVPKPVSGAPTCIGIQKETDTAFMTAVNQWLAKMHSSGETRRVILANMEKLVGIKAADFPKEVTL